MFSQNRGTSCTRFSFSFGIFFLNTKGLKKAMVNSRGTGDADIADFFVGFREEGRTEANIYRRD